MTGVIRKHITDRIFSQIDMTSYGMADISSTDISSTDISSTDISSNGHFVEDGHISSNGQFVERTFRRKDNSSKRHFIEKTFHRMDIFTTPFLLKRHTLTEPPWGRLHPSKTKKGSLAHYLHWHQLRQLPLPSQRRIQTIALRKTQYTPLGSLIPF